MTESGRLAEQEMGMIFVNWRELITCNHKFLKYGDPPISTALTVLINVYWLTAAPCRLTVLMSTGTLLPPAG